MANYAVDPATLNNTSQDMIGATNQISSALDMLDSALNTYLASNTGQTADAYRAAQQNWQAGVQEMRGALTKGASNLTDISHLYRTTDLRGAASFGG